MSLLSLLFFDFKRSITRSLVIGQTLFDSIFRVHSNGTIYKKTYNSVYWTNNFHLIFYFLAQRAVFGFTQQRDYCPIEDGIGLENQPGPILFFLKYLANFTVGIACAVWTLNGKTVVIYGEFMSRLCMGEDRGRSVRLSTRVH